MPWPVPHMIPRLYSALARQPCDTTSPPQHNSAIRPHPYSTCPQEGTELRRGLGQQRGDTTSPPQHSPGAGYPPVVDAPEIGLGEGVALVGGESIPPHRLSMVLRHALAFVVHVRSKRDFAPVQAIAQPVPLLSPQPPMCAIVIDRTRTARHGEATGSRRPRGAYNRIRSMRSRHERDGQQRKLGLQDPVRGHGRCRRGCARWRYDHALGRERG